MYKFKSRAAADLIMLETNGRQVLSIIGKLASPAEGKGILLPVHMLAAVEALEKAVALDEARRMQLAQEAQEKGEAPTKMEGISLRLRAVPFIEMMKRSHKADAEIVWGV